MVWLLLLFVVVPAVELALLIEVGSRIGTLPTFGLILLTGVVGASLARAQGLGVLRRIRRELADGTPPAAALVDGAIVLFSAALLLTPGILTDLVGFAGLIPPVRAALRRLGWRFIEASIRTGRIRVQTFSEHAGYGEPSDIEPEYDVVPGTPSDRPRDEDADSDVGPKGASLPRGPSRS